MTYQYHLAIHPVLFKLHEIEQQFPWHDQTKKCTISVLIVTIVALLVTTLLRGAASFLTLGILTGGGIGAVLIAICIKRTLPHLLPVADYHSSINRYPRSNHPENGGDIDVEQHTFPKCSQEPVSPT